MPTTTSPHALTHHWKRNLVAVWLNQFLTLTAFAFGVPFMTYYLQKDLGVVDHDEVVWWTSACQAAAPLTFMLAAPLWGALADRWGHRAMLVRANVAAAVILAGMGFVTAPIHLVLLRGAQGLFTGIMSASQTLVSVGTPSHRKGLAMGMLSVAVYAGFLLGNSLGGICADWLGFRVAFYVGGILGAVATLVSVFAVKEVAVATVVAETPVRVSMLKRALGGIARGAGHARPLWPILALMGGLGLARHLPMPVLPLLVQELNGGRVQGSSTWMGGLHAVSSIAAIVGGLLAGVLAKRFAGRTAVVALVAAAACCLPLTWVAGFPLLTGCCIAMALWMAILDPLCSTWLSHLVDPERQGFLFGLAFSCRSLAWFIAPLLGGVIASELSLRSVYPFQAGSFLLLLPLVAVVALEAGKRAGPAASSDLPTPD